MKYKNCSVGTKVVRKQSAMTEAWKIYCSDFEKPQDSVYTIAAVQSQHFNKKDVSISFSELDSDIFWCAQFFRLATVEDFK